MTDILLCSENFVKGVCPISDNISAKYMIPAIREAQDISLREILGDGLTDALMNKVADSSIIGPENEMYKRLLDKAQYFIAYRTISNLCVSTSFKIDNIGVSRTTDENIQAVDFDDVYNVADYYQKRADWYCRKLQHFVLNNKKCYPELNECSCRRIKANLYSSASCGLFLGGARGRRLRR